MGLSDRKRKIACGPEYGEVTEEPARDIHMDELVEDFLIRTRRLLIVGTIDENMSANICSNLQILSLSNAPIFIYINSPGGCLSSGYAIIDQILACKSNIVTIVRGQAYSMAAVIAAFGTKGLRYATANSSFMLHSLIIGMPQDHIEKQSIMIEYLKDDYNKKIANIARRTKLNKRQLSDMMRDTRWMSTGQAKKIGLIDGVWSPKMEQSINKGFKR